MSSLWTDSCLTLISKMGLCRTKESNASKSSKLKQQVSNNRNKYEGDPSSPLLWDEDDTSLVWLRQREVPG